MLVAVISIARIQIGFRQTFGKIGWYMSNDPPIGDCALDEMQLAMELLKFVIRISDRNSLHLVGIYAETARDELAVRIDNMR